MTSLGELQHELKTWQKHNFPGRDAWEPLVGVMEESGELAHAHLKRHQGIRGTPEDLDEAAKDAVGDIIVYLADYCNARGFDLQGCLNAAWFEVRQRDWMTPDRAAAAPRADSREEKERSE